MRESECCTVLKSTPGLCFGDRLVSLVCGNRKKMRMDSTVGWGCRDRGWRGEAREEGE